MFRYVFLFALLALARAGSVDVDDCGGDRPAPDATEITDCDDLPCQLVHGNNYSFKFSFTSPADASDLKLSVKAKVFGIWVPWSGVPSKVCGSGIQCPLKEGQSYEYTSSINIGSFVPSISTVVEYSVQSTSGPEIFCAHVPVQIK